MPRRKIGQETFGFEARDRATARDDSHGLTEWGPVEEADWPDAAAVDRYVRHRAHQEDAERAFQRFPTWMWRYTEIDVRNAGIADMNARAGFRGLDIYNMSASKRCCRASSTPGSGSTTPRPSSRSGRSTPGRARPRPVRSSSERVRALA